MVGEHENLLLSPAGQHMKPKDLVCSRLWLTITIHLRKFSLVISKSSIKKKFCFCYSLFLYVMPLKISSQYVIISHKCMGFQFVCFFNWPFFCISTVLHLVWFYFFSVLQWSHTSSCPIANQNQWLLFCSQNWKRWVDGRLAETDSQHPITTTTHPAALPRWPWSWNR